MFKINRLISNLINYRKKILPIIFYEIIYSIKYFKSGNNYKIQDHNIRTDAIPCPYFFIREITKFVNENKISSLIDLGSGFGRITNFLSDTTKALVFGHEANSEIFEISIKNKKNNVVIKNQDILTTNYNNLNIDCFILNDPLKKINDLEKLIKKIELSKVNHGGKYYLVSININKEKSYVFNKYILIKNIEAGSSRSIKFYSNK